MADIDYLTIIVTMFSIVIPVSLLIGFVFFKKYIPRFCGQKKYPVIIKGPDGKVRRETVGWKMKDGRSLIFHVCMKGIIGFYKGVDFDYDFINLFNERGELVLLEKVEDNYEPSNYEPIERKLTQAEAFQKDVVRDIVEQPIFDIRAEKDADGKDVIVKVIDNQRLDLIIKQNLTKYSRLSDMSGSNWFKTGLQSARIQEQRGAGNNWLEKYGPVVILIVAMLFSYMIYDSTNKAAVQTMGGVVGPIQAAADRAYVQCGGHLVVNNTTVTQPNPTGINLPFISH